MTGEGVPTVPSVPAIQTRKGFRPKAVQLPQQAPQTIPPPPPPSGQERDCTFLIYECPRCHGTSWMVLPDTRVRLMLQDTKQWRPPFWIGCNDGCTGRRAPKFAIRCATGEVPFLSGELLTRRTDGLLMVLPRMDVRKLPYRGGMTDAEFEAATHPQPAETKPPAVLEDGCVGQHSRIPLSDCVACFDGKCGRCPACKEEGVTDGDARPTA